jgi:Tol biopolymer transport system component
MQGIEGATFSRDGRWLYVSTGSCNFSASLYRYPVANPPAVERVDPVLGDGCFSPVHKWPSPSPDDSRVVFESQSGNRMGYSVRLLTIATRTITVLVEGAQRPRWSPTGDQIAYWNASRIWRMRPDGSGVRAVSPAGREYVPGVQWSPDGQWLITRFSPTRGWAGTTVALLHVETGLEIPLPWTTGYGGYGLPAWRPAPSPPGTVARSAEP